MAVFSSYFRKGIPTGGVVAAGVLFFLYSVVFVVSREKEAAAADKNEAS